MTPEKVDGVSKLTRKEFREVAKLARQERGFMCKLSHDRELMTATDGEKDFYLYFNGTWWVESRSVDQLWRRYNAEVRG